MRSRRLPHFNDPPLSASVDVTASDWREPVNFGHLLDSPRLLGQLSQITCCIGPRVPAECTVDMLCDQHFGILRYTSNLQCLSIIDVYKEDIFAALGHALSSEQDGVVVMNLWPRLASMNLYRGLRAPWIKAESISDIITLSPSLTDLVVLSDFAADQVQIGQVALKVIIGLWAALHTVLVASAPLCSVQIRDPSGGGTWGFSGVIHMLGTVIPHPALSQVVVFKMTNASAPSSGMDSLLQHLVRLQDLTIPVRPTLEDGDNGLLQALSAVPRRGLRSLTVVSQYDFQSGPGPYGISDAQIILRALERLDARKNNGAWWLRRLRFAFLTHVNRTDARSVAGILDSWCRSRRIVLRIG